MVGRIQFTVRDGTLEALKTCNEPRQSRACFVLPDRGGPAGAQGQASV